MVLQDCNSHVCSGQQHLSVWGGQHLELFAWMKHPTGMLGRGFQLFTKVLQKSQFCRSFLQLLSRCGMVNMSVVDDHLTMGNS